MFHVKHSKEADTITSRRHASRKAQRGGATFEADLEIANRYYQMHRKGVVSKIPTGTHMIGKRGGRQQWAPTEKTGCDYLGVYGGTAVAIEAKSTSQKTRFPLKAHQKPMVKDHQLEFLQHYQESGGRSYIVIEFRPLKTVYRLTIDDYLQLKDQAEADNKKSIPIAWFAGLPEIKRNGYVLDYLAGID